MWLIGVADHAEQSTSRSTEVSISKPKFRTNVNRISPGNGVGSGGSERLQREITSLPGQSQ
jgi:hypothetical protein